MFISSKGVLYKLIGCSVSMNVDQIVVVIKTIALIL